VLTAGTHADFNFPFLDGPGAIQVSSLAELAATIAAQAIRRAGFG